jgi:hypothetical protein
MSDLLDSLTTGTTHSLLPRLDTTPSSRLLDNVTDNAPWRSIASRQSIAAGLRMCLLLDALKLSLEIPVFRRQNYGRLP